LPPSQYVFVAVWAAGADGASSRWSEELFVAAFDVALYHGGFFADFATRPRELATVERKGVLSLHRGSLRRHIERHAVTVLEIPP
jgi:hypothetical protein